MGKVIKNKLEPYVMTIEKQDSLMLRTKTIQRAVRELGLKGHRTTELEEKKLKPTAP